MKSLLIGLGSIGKRHLQELSSRSNEVVIFDLQNKFPDLLREVRKAKFYSSWNLLTKNHQSFDCAVISTWGPNHLIQLRNVASLGIKSVLIEKPMASSLKDINQILEISQQNKIRIFENFHLRYSHLKNSVKSLEKQFSLGAVRQVNVSGGANCISTNGVHYLDLCEWIFECRPTTVMSDATFNYINPRSPTLRVYGGLAKWTYPNGGILTINFNNDSFCQTVVEFIWKNAKGILVGETLTLFAPEDFPDHDQQTTARTKPFTRKLAEFDAIRLGTGKDGITNLYDSFFTSNQVYLNSNPGSSTKDLIGALVASSRKTTISLIDDIMEFNETDWEIS